MSNIDYGKVITIDSIHDGKVLATKVKYEQSIFSDKDSLLKDIIESMGIITGGLTKNLTLEVKVSDEKIRIIKTWVS